ncbi:thioredoxin family protein [Thermosynechococcus sp. GLH187]|nr:MULTISPECIES: thioredoxin family protein [unclassified Thermosynechococcus]QEP99945.1 thioredoxin family protein [Thermosynechococcus sp. CL-1]QSF49254.1 thioredoxin family protein [Thermosynechococcus sp. TA-1]WKT83769.1 thioredoxin family protein [Thermosynechococcus sp. HY596]WNC30011.1 thioredoxin family protein [Thermosynechococcus sp. PKX82]WNC45171.1 thioredoxin family protein [Thermosynechococcus sp. GLH187]WNC47707.1 thioredoxin family protein [Thermosynechococcus sp. GLH333]WNC5
MTLKIEILGTNCKKCQQLEVNTQTAVKNLNLAAEITHVTDSLEIANRGVMSTPALAINGKVVSKGKVLTPEEIASFLK